MKTIYSILFFLFCSLSLIAQPKNFSNEIGIAAELAGFVSDYNDFDLDNYSGNIGFSISIVHFMSFSSIGGDCYSKGKNGFFHNHFKVRNEVSYTRSNLKHYGNAVDENNTSVLAPQLRGMRGETTILSIGSSIEFYPWSIKRTALLLPHIGIGVRYNHYNPKVYSTIGILGDPAITPPRYLNGFNNDSGSAFSIVGNAGMRIRISAKSDVLAQIKLQYFFSDWIEGLRPDPTLFPENKQNDFIFGGGIGYIYYLD
ncbi:THC0290_0291 family protein [Leptobacterium sp. I13]|uniref:THC0290_0291 family protein n=1 Tax=Leptobacterium meishanense TaxID=3128904 RepID=UPI0030EEB7CE